MNAKGMQSGGVSEGGEEGKEKVLKSEGNQSTLHVYICIKIT
jgi:hypothetical protein